LYLFRIYIYLRQASTSDKLTDFQPEPRNSLVLELQVSQTRGDFSQLESIILFFIVNVLLIEVYIFNLNVNLREYIIEIFEEYEKHVWSIPLVSILHILRL
jgi:hypothetical protein